MTHPSWLPNVDYDGMSRLTRLKDATVAATLLDRQYSCNTANQISGITEPSRARTFGYDDINRLTSATDSLLASESYAFDAVDNRTSSHLSATYTTDPFNRTTGATGITQTFDSNGNTATRSVGGTNWTYTWDRENRLTNASSASASVDFVYDGLGRRVKRIDGSGTTEFTHDGEDVLLDDSSASGITKYQNGPAKAVGDQGQACEIAILGEIWTQNSGGSAAFRLQESVKNEYTVMSYYDTLVAASDL